MNPGFVRLAHRWLALVAIAVWFGGFTFYSAVVVPLLSDVMGKVEAGSMITREVTVTLNWIGVGAMAVWWALAIAERSTGDRWAGRVRLACLGVNSALLGWLFALHRQLGEQIDTASMTGFYARHEFYLILSTIQWAATLVLIAASLRIWSAASDQRWTDSPVATPAASITASE
ncbi:MAG: hypothetical protein AB7I30_18775 [Isosphaeraceae bacterium]